MKARTKRKLQKKERLELENKKYIEIIEQLQSKIKNDDYLKEENKRLVEWVQKILKEFGTYEVRERNVQIPIMKFENAYSIGENNLVMDITDDIVIIPEIRICKTTRRF